MLEESFPDTLGDEYVVVQDPAFEEEEINGRHHVTHDSERQLDAHRNVSKEDLEKLRNWLFPTDYDSDSADLRKHLTAHTAGTCQWLRARAEFQQWHDSSDTSLLWIEGVPGSGKSVLCSHQIDWLHDNGSGPVLHFFFRRTIEANQTPIALVRDWACQLLPHSTSLASGLLDEMTHHPTINTVPFDTLWGLLIVGIANTQKVYCILDALDELEPGSEYFYENLHALALLNPANTKLMVTTRRLDQTEQIYAGTKYAKVKLKPLNTEEDIAAFVQSRLSSFEFLELDNETRRRLCNTICTLSNGLFLYAKLSIDELLEKGGNLGKEWLISSLSDLPKGVENMYASILNEQRLRTGVLLKDQLAILGWVTHAVRPLRLIELADMLNMPDGESAIEENQAKAKDTVRRACGSLLEVLPDGTVQVVLYSLTEYLTDQRRVLDASQPDSTFPVIDNTEAHLNIARTCLGYLSFSWFLDPWMQRDCRLPGRHAWRTRSQEFSFLDYTARNWAKHVQLCGTRQNELFRLLDQFMLANPQLLQNWLVFYLLPLMDWDMYNMPEKFGSLHTAAMLGLDLYASKLLEDNKLLALDKTGSYRTALSYAAEEGHLATVEILLKHSSVNIHCIKDIDPLEYAARAGHVGVVRSLLLAGADPYSLSPKCDCVGCNCGARQARHGVNVRSRPYEVAIKNGHTHVVKELASHSWHDPQVGEETLLHTAARCGRLEVVAFLLEHGRTPVDSRDCFGSTPLFEAAYSWKAGVVRLLLAHGANDTILPLPRGRDDLHHFNQSLSTGDTLLHALTCTFRVSGFETKATSKVTETSGLMADLLSAGADTNARNSKGETPLHHASMHRRSTRMVEVLLDGGANPSSADGFGSQPLHVASPEMIPLLVAAGADPDARRNDGQTPLHVRLTTISSDWKGIELLLKAGADVDLQDREGNTPLMLSTNHSGSRTFKLLCSAAANPSTKNSHKEGLLHEMSEGLFLKCISTIKGWLAEGILNVNDQNADGETALFVSTLRGEQEKANVLLECGADLGVNDLRERSLLHAVAASFSHNGSETRFPIRTAKVDLLRRFLDAGLDVSAIDVEGNTPLMAVAKAAWSDPYMVLDKAENDYRHEVIDLLAKSGTPLSCKNTAGQTCLHLSASSMDRLCGYSSAVGKDLPLHSYLKLGLDVDAKDNDGNTPLHAAASVNRSTGCLAEYHVSALLERGANPGILNNEGKTPLHLAAESGQCGSVDILLGSMWSNKARDQQDSSGNTALHCAVNAGKLPTVRSLLDACANHSLTNKNGDTPLDLAKRYSGDEYCGLPELKSHHAYEIILTLQKIEARDNEATYEAYDISLQDACAVDVEICASEEEEEELDLKELDQSNSQAATRLKRSLFRFVKIRRQQKGNARGNR